MTQAFTEAARPARAKTGVLRIAKTVAWSFFGVRRMADHHEAAAHLTLPQAIVAGVIGAATVVACFATIARLATS